MNGYSKSFVAVALLSSLVLMYAGNVAGAGPKVSEIGNPHNLSSVGRVVGSTVLTDNTTLYRAEGDISSTTNVPGKQVCIFCHTPHNANVSEQAPLWNRAFSTVTNFQRYSSSTLQIRVNAAARTPALYDTGAQPDGSSKLCLSCHDGVSKLGAILQGGTIIMRGGAGSSTTGGGDVITGLSSFNPSTNKMKTGHHPVSFVYNATVRDAINAGKGTTYTLPSEPAVILRNSKMQCTTCHDAHQNQSDDTSCYDTSDNSITTCGSTSTATRKVAPFWVLHNGSNTASQDHDVVCTTCHPMVTPSPFQTAP
ncbi:MAG: cytochrome C [Geobacter sp.]|nr:MAG: cytochrome C [Geobacter sp.]